MKTLFLMSLLTMLGLSSVLGQDKPPFKYDEANVKTTPSGLKYVIVEEGKGEKPAAGSKVSVHYHGMLADGKVFDSSFNRGQPFGFNLGKGQVIKGWDEGIALLPVGTKAVLIVPPNLGYGERNMGSIPPNSTLYFHVQLMGVTPPPAPFKPYAYKESDLKTTASGLKYYIVEEGTGTQAAAGKNVSVHYHGMLTDGTVFDSSHERGEPISFPLGQGMVIKGWDEGIAMLKTGSKAVLVIPPNLGYGDRAAGKIPPNATLVFHVNLVSVQ